MTPANPPETQPKAVNYAMLLNRFNRIIRTTGIKAAAGRLYARNGFLVNPDQTY
jgi:hypothetical protein